MSRGQTLWRTLALGSALSAGCGTLLDIASDPGPPPPPAADGASLAEASASEDAPPSDGSSDVRTEEASATVDAGPVPKVVFVTTTTLTASGGRNAFDMICASEGTAAGLSGKIVAWVSTATGPVPANAVDRLNDNVVWYLPSVNDAGPAVVAFPSKKNIAAGGTARAGITRGADGREVLPNPGAHVWTATKLTGTAYVSDCAGWSSASALDTAGYGDFGAFNSPLWTLSGDDPCSKNNYILCFQL